MMVPVRERGGIMCERCREPAGVEVDVVADGVVVATLVGCRECQTGICADQTGDDDGA